MGTIYFSEVDFDYGSRCALKSVNLRLPAGEFVGIVGPNGAGKTTLLKLAAGIILPKRGFVTIAEKPPRVASQIGLIGYVPQLQNDSSVGFPATVREIVGLGTLRNLRKSRLHIIRHMLELTGLSGYENTRIDELSGGYRQRMLVARALAQNPRVLLLDEPTSGIDAPSCQKLFELLRNINDKLGVTIVMVSHDIANVTEYTRRIICVNRGICYQGSAVEFKNNHLHHHLLFEFPTMSAV